MGKRKYFSTIASTACAASVVLLFGCAAPDKLSRERFDRIRINTTSQHEVRELIGPPDSTLADIWLYHRPADHLEVMLDFDEQGRVVRKQWIDGLGERWEDSNE